MQAKTELWLHILFSVFDGILDYPSATALSTYHDCRRQDEFLRQVRRLQQRAILEEARSPDSADRLYRLTELGRATLLGGIRPRARIQRAWDGIWRLVAFDVPQDRSVVRARWRRELRRLKFGCLQGSVWISPDPVHEIKTALEGAAVRTERLLFLEGRPAAGESDLQIVQSAWNLEGLARLHARHHDVLRKLPSPRTPARELRARLPEWFRREFLSWREILARDPLLPRSLWPPGYAIAELIDARDHAMCRARRLARMLAAKDD